MASCNKCGTGNLRRRDGVIHCKHCGPSGFPVSYIDESGRVDMAKYYIDREEADVYVGD